MRMNDLPRQATPTSALQMTMEASTPKAQNGASPDYRMETAIAAESAPAAPTNSTTDKNIRTESLSIEKNHAKGTRPVENATGVKRDREGNPHSHHQGGEKKQADSPHLKKMSQDRTSSSKASTDGSGMPQHAKKPKLEGEAGKNSTSSREGGKPTKSGESKEHKRPKECKDHKLPKEAKEGTPRKDQHHHHQHRTMGQNQVSLRHFPASEGVSKVSERANE